MSGDSGQRGRRRTRRTVTAGRGPRGARAATGHEARRSARRGASAVAADTDLLGRARDGCSAAKRSSTGSTHRHGPGPPMRTRPAATAARPARDQPTARRGRRASAGRRLEDGRAGARLEAPEAGRRSKRPAGSQRLALHLARPPDAPPRRSTVGARSMPVTRARPCAFVARRSARAPGPAPSPEGPATGKQLPRAAPALGRRERSREDERRAIARRAEPSAQAPPRPAASSPTNGRSWRAGGGVKRPGGGSAATTCLDPVPGERPAGTDEASRPGHRPSAGARPAAPGARIASQPRMRSPPEGHVRQARAGRRR